MSFRNDEQAMLITVFLFGHMKKETTLCFLQIWRGKHATCPNLIITKRFCFHTFMIERQTKLGQQQRPFIPSPWRNFDRNRRAVDRRVERGEMIPTTTRGGMHSRIPLPRGAVKEELYNLIIWNMCCTDHQKFNINEMWRGIQLQLGRMETGTQVRHKDRYTTSI